MSSSKDFLPSSSPMSSICAIEIEAILFLFMMNCYKSSFQECVTIIVLIIGREEPVAILFISATRKDCIPPPPVGLSWDSPDPLPESVRTDGRMDGRTLTSEPKFFGSMGYQICLPMVLHELRYESNVQSKFDCTSR